MDKNIIVILRDGGFHEITQDQIENWAYLFPEANVYDEIFKMKIAWEEGTLPRRTAKNINKFIAKHLEYKNKENAS